MQFAIQEDKIYLFSQICISCIVFMAICSPAQYQPHMTAQFVMTDKAEVRLVIKVECSDMGNAGSLLNVVTHALHHLW